MDPILTLKQPAEFAQAEFDALRSLVHLGGAVGHDTFPTLFRRAVAVGFFSLKGEMIAAAALKNPFSTYRTAVFRKALTTVRSEEYPTELGWFTTHPAFQRKGLAGRLATSLAAVAEGGVYATTHSPAIVRILERLRFRDIGQPYASMVSPGEVVSLYVRD